MTYMELLYLAHPVRPLFGSTETVDGNLDDAEWWLANLQRANPGVAIIAPWIQTLRLGVDMDSDEKLRAQGLARAQAAALRCNGILLCGPRISNGMLAELACTAGQVNRYPVVHRFRDRTLSLEIPSRHRCYSCDLPVTAPTWLERFSFGAAPEAIEVVGAEILAALEREVVKS